MIKLKLFTESLRVLSKHSMLNMLQSHNRTVLSLKLKYKCTFWAQCTNHFAFVSEAAFCLYYVRKSTPVYTQFMNTVLLSAYVFGEVPHKTWMETFYIFVADFVGNFLECSMSSTNSPFLGLLRMEGFRQTKDAFFKNIFQKYINK